jgi:hypothetical protein
MMKEKPIIFNFLWLFFTAIAISLPLQVAFLYEHDLTLLSEWQSVLMKLTPLNWIVALATLVNAALCFTANPYIRYSIPASIVLVGINNFFVGSWGTDFSLLLTWIGTLAYAVMSYSYIYAHGLEAIENPQKQWWKIPKRMKRSYPVWIEWNGQRKLLAKTFDISKTGAFVSSMTQSPSLFPDDLDIGEKVKVLIGTNQGELKIPATVIRREKIARGLYPSGLGLSFDQMALSQNFLLRRVLAAKEVMNV